MEEKKLIKTIVIDTLTAFQKQQMFAKAEKGRIPITDWADYGNDLCLFIERLATVYKFEVIAILGYEGTGKSYGMKFLPSGTNLWFNSDCKNPTWKGGREEYGTITNKKGYMVLPKDYDDVYKILDATEKAGRFDVQRYAFVTAHIEAFKGTGDKTRERLKTLGKLSQKMNIEDKFTNCFYTEVSEEDGKPVYMLNTQNNGANTARSLENLFPERLIPNNFQMIVDAIEKY